MLRAYDAIDHHYERMEHFTYMLSARVGQSMTSAGENTQTTRGGVCALGVESGFLSERIAARDSNSEI